MRMLWIRSILWSRLQDRIWATSPIAVDSPLPEGKPVIPGDRGFDMEVEAPLAGTSESTTAGYALMQCNTNYTGAWRIMKHVNLLVLQSYAQRWPGLPLGLSDHTHGHALHLALFALGARVIEKHFTDNYSRKGPIMPLR